MENKPFYCKVVGMGITADVCERRIKQAKEFRDKGDPHPSLNKCIICEGLVPAEPAAPGEPVDKEACSICNNPKVHKKLRWNKKRGLHNECYSNSKRHAKVMVTRPMLDVKTTTATPTEDPERII